MSLIKFLQVSMSGALSTFPITIKSGCEGLKFVKINFASDSTISPCHSDLQAMALQWGISPDSVSRKISCHSTLTERSDTL